MTGKHTNGEYTDLVLTPVVGLFEYEGVRLEPYEDSTDFSMSLCTADLVPVFKDNRFQLMRVDNVNPVPVLDCYWDLRFVEHDEQAIKEWCVSTFMAVRRSTKQPIQQFHFQVMKVLSGVTPVMFYMRIYLDAYFTCAFHPELLQDYKSEFKCENCLALVKAGVAHPKD